MKSHFARIILYFELALLTYLIWHNRHLLRWAELKQDILPMTLAGLLVGILLTSITIMIVSKNRSTYLKRTSHLLETRRVLRRQQEALLKIATNKALFDGDIFQALREICELAAITLNINAVGIWQFDKVQNKISSLNIFNRSLGTHSTGAEILKEQNPKYFDYINASRIVAIDDVSKEPGFSNYIHLLDSTASAVMMAPARINGELIGVVCFGTNNPGNSWSSDEQHFAASIADFFSMALEAQERRKIELSRKNAEETYQKGKAFLRRVIDTDPNLIFAKDASGRFTLVNQAVAQIYGTTVEDIVGKKDSDFNPQGDEVEHFLEDDKIVIEQQRDVFIREEKITDSQGQMHWLQTIKRPLKLADNEPVQVLGVATDITETKRLHEQLLQAQKMEAIGQLAGGIAHDFNNYLTGIIGYTGLLKYSSTRPKEVERAADLIESIAQKAAQLTEKLLGFARKGKHQNASVDIHNSIRETVALLSRTIEKDITIMQLLCAETSYTQGDPMQIQQVILNLALNARDAIQCESNSKGQARIEISTKLLNLPEDFQLNDQQPKPGRYLMLQVKDTGCGIDPQIKEKIFEPFFTTKGPSKGTGMGLAMVYGIVKNHGGAISVESTPALGSAFTIFLPSIDPPLHKSVEVERTPSVSGQGHILIVDDHQVIRDVTTRMLTSLGYDVVTAKDGLEALEYFKENWRDIDLVILDMVMPNMGARECFRELKRINPRVRSILSTGYDKNNAAQEILNEGIADFVQKPYQLQKLSEIVARVLHS